MATLAFHASVPQVLFKSDWKLIALALCLNCAYRGSNVIEVQLPDGEESLAILPTRFRKLIWVKRGDYLLVSSSSGEIETCK
jgi:hypothetical protein